MFTQEKNSGKNCNQKSSSEVYVLDASAIYNGILAHNLVGLKYIPECVLSEIRGMLRGEAIIEEALLYEDLKIISPSNNSLTKINNIAIETGDIQELSSCDLEVIAIALDLTSLEYSVIILSDDYDIQNLASHIGIPNKGIHWKGISTIHQYHYVCPACGSRSKQKSTNCIECGTEMVRKTKKRKIGKRGRL